MGAMVRVSGHLAQSMRQGWLRCAFLGVLITSIVVGGTTVYFCSYGVVLSLYPPINRRWPELYEPVRLVTDRSSLRGPLLAWADACGVGWDARSECYLRTGDASALGKYVGAFGDASPVKEPATVSE